MRDFMENNQQSVSFEQAINELEEIIKKLEEGRLPLEEAVISFERGTELKKICEEKLKNAQLKIEMLNSEQVESYSSSKSE